MTCNQQYKYDLKAASSRLKAFQTQSFSLSAFGFARLNKGFKLFQKLIQAYFCKGS